MEGVAAMKSTTTHIIFALLMLMGSAQADVALEWAVVGDSWASGVAYNLTNVYAPTDNESCYRSKEAWGVQMSKDNSWSQDPQAFNFAACGGSLMDDLTRQMTEKAGQPDIVWGMFGGNNAFFGAIARACIYQPISPEHPFGWGLPWDEDPTGTGLCKQNIKLAETYLSQPAGSGYRKDFTKALNDIVTFAQGKQALNQPFDLYVSSYVQFFDNTTDACDGWTFAHDRLSTGKPKLVKGLRTVINENVQQLNSIQADIIKNYQIPAHTPMNPNFRVHNSQPDSTFQGHRFCEQGHTFEDQYYNQDVWLWNLQYYDEKTGSEEVGVPTTTGGVEFMAAPPGLDVTQGFETVMGDDTNPAAVIPQGDDVNTQQYGFGWTARPFHPKYPGHTALANFFIQQMRNDNIPGVEPTASTAPTPPAPTLVCNGLTSNKYVTHDLIKDTISNTFCPAAVKQGPMSQRYNQGTPEEVVITLTGPNGFKPSLTDCTNYLLGAITEDCDTSSPPPNYKGGGTETIGNVVYSIQPQNVRQPAAKGLQYGCDSTYKVVFNEYTVWGHGFDSADHGDDLKKQLGGCALLPNTWSFAYGDGSDGREWTATFRTGVFQKRCVGDAVKTAGAPNSGCTGSG